MGRHDARRWSLRQVPVLRTSVRALCCVKPDLTIGAISFRPSGPGIYNGDMERTFSLARLMVVITLICVVCAVAAYYGKDFGAYLLLVALFAPTGIVCLLLGSFSRRPKTTMVISFAGAFLVAFFMPMGHMGRPSMNVWELILRDFGDLAVFPPLGSLVFGGAVLTDEYFSHHESSKD